MDLSEKIKICSMCKNHKKDEYRGVLCNLTNKKPSFEENCENFRYHNKKQLNSYKLEDASRTAGKFLIYGGLILLPLSIIVFVISVLVSNPEVFNTISAGTFFIYFFIYIISALFYFAITIILVNISYRATEIHKLLKKKEDKE